MAILAGGQGTRLRPLTTVFPKPLVPLGNKPIIEILLRRLAAFGFRDVTVCTGYLAALIRAVCGDGSSFGVSLSYVQEQTALGTAGPLSLLSSPSDPFFVMNGDLLTTLDFERMLQHHRASGAMATIAVAHRDVAIDFGVIERGPDGGFGRYVEKPTLEYTVSMGAYVLDRRVLELIEPDTRLDMPHLITRIAGSGGMVGCYEEDCYWLDIGRMDDYGLAQEQFTENPDRFLGPVT